jgi:hypothetical protein
MIPFRVSSFLIRPINKSSTVTFSGYEYWRKRALGSSHKLEAIGYFRIVTSHVLFKSKPGRFCSGFSLTTMAYGIETLRYAAVIYVRLEPIDPERLLSTVEMIIGEQAD